MSVLFSIVLEFFKVVPHRWMPMLIPELETGGGGGGEVMTQGTLCC